LPHPASSRLAEALGAAVVSVVPVEGRGYSHARRYLVDLADGRRVFAKLAVDAMTTEWLRLEHLVYRGVDGSFLPRLVAFLEEPAVLVLEDLSGAYWPPPWRPGDVEAVCEALTLIASTPPPEEIPAVVADPGWLGVGWAEVDVTRQPLLGLGLCSPEWLDSALPALRMASEHAPLAGDALLHLDVRSDNICITGRRAVLVDWNLCRVGNPALDLAFWLPSLHAEGGPAPEELLPEGAAELAALVAGFFAARAGLPPPATAPRVREVQLAQLRVALPWAARALGLDPPVTIRT
jgi:Phosphotransferase enzyme family